MVGRDGMADGFAPAVGAECVDVFVLGDVDRLQEGLQQISDGAGTSLLLCVVEAEVRVAADARSAAAAPIFESEQT